MTRRGVPLGYELNEARGSRVTQITRTVEKRVCVVICRAKFQDPYYYCGS